MILDYPKNKIDGTMRLLKDNAYYFFDVRTPAWKNNEWQRDWMRYDKAKRLGILADFEVRWCKNQKKRRFRKEKQLEMW